MNISFRKRLANFLTDTKVNFTFDIINGIATIICSIGYIASTYQEDIFSNYGWGSITFLFHFYFFTEYIIRLYAAKNRYTYFLSRDSIIDIISNVPFFLVRFIYEDALVYNPNIFAHQWVGMLSLFRILRLERMKIYMVKL